MKKYCVPNTEICLINTHETVMQQAVIDFKSVPPAEEGTVINANNNLWEEGEEDDKSFQSSNLWDD
jgi:hypothetical protein